MSETVTLCSCSCHWWASITGARPVVRNCVGGVSVGSTGHSPCLSNEGNTTLPHTNTLHSHLQSQAPLPVSITASVIDVRYSQTLPGGPQAIKINSTLTSEIRLRLMRRVMFVYVTTDISLDTTKSGRLTLLPLWNSDFSLIPLLLCFNNNLNPM